MADDSRSATARWVIRFTGTLRKDRPPRKTCYHGAAQTPSLSEAVFVVAKTRSSPRGERTAARLCRSLSAPALGEHEERGQASRPCHTPEAACGTLWGYRSLPTILIPITRERCKSIRRIVRVTFPNVSASSANGGVRARLGLIGTCEMSVSRPAANSLCPPLLFSDGLLRFSFGESPSVAAPTLQESLPPRRFRGRPLLPVILAKARTHRRRFPWPPPARGWPEGGTSLFCWRPKPTQRILSHRIASYREFGARNTAGSSSGSPAVSAVPRQSGTGTPYRSSGRFSELV